MWIDRLSNLVRCGDLSRPKFWVGLRIGVELSFRIVSFPMGKNTLSWKKRRQKEVALTRFGRWLEIGADRERDSRGPNRCGVAMRRPCRRKISVHRREPTCSELLRRPFWRWFQGVAVQGAVVETLMGSMGVVKGNVSGRE